jgi:hypothetical protein
MHASELAQLAALVAHHTPVLIRGTERTEKDALEQYWVASKTRLDQWLWSLRSHQLRLARTPLENGAELWRAVRPVLDEILLSETLTRVWAAFGCAIDRERGTDEVEPIARSVLVGHLEGRNRALQLIVFGQGLGADDAVALNRLRRRVERWTDLMLGYVMLEFPATEFAFDPCRVMDFADDLRQERRAGTHHTSWELVQSSLAEAFQKERRSVAASSDLNAKIAAGVIGCFDAAIFDAEGAPKSHWQVRLAQVADDTHDMIDQLLRDDPPAAEPIITSEGRIPLWEPRLPRF